MENNKYSKLVDLSVKIDEQNKEAYLKTASLDKKYDELLSKVKEAILTKDFEFKHRCSNDWTNIGIIATKVINVDQPFILLWKPNLKKMVEELVSKISESHFNNRKIEVIPDWGKGVIDNNLKIVIYYDFVDSWEDYDKTSVLASRKYHLPFLKEEAQISHMEEEIKKSFGNSPGYYSFNLLKLEYTEKKQKAVDRIYHTKLLEQLKESSPTLEEIVSIIEDRCLNAEGFKELPESRPDFRFGPTLVTTVKTPMIPSTHKEAYEKAVLGALREKLQSGFDLSLSLPFDIRVTLWNGNELDVKLTWCR
jgi:hypothetical protein